jgi:hypothetical protein
MSGVRFYQVRFDFPELCLVSSIKGEVKKKHDAIGWISFCFAARLFEQELF